MESQRSWIGTIKPGITFIFEAAPDTMYLQGPDLAVGQPDIHVEGRVNWSEEGTIPKGASKGGFVSCIKN